MKKLKTLAVVALMLPLTVVGFSGCDGDDDDGESAGDDDGNDDDDDDDETGGDEECADPNDADAYEGVDADITSDTTWTCDKVYVLENLIFVNGAELTIEAGTTIRGQNGSALVIEKDSTIEAIGTEDAPIVFTSHQPEGSRNSSDWGGVVLLGNGLVNLAGGTGEAEGFPVAPSYGGSDASHDCGTLQYVRVEWAGYEVSAGSELNGITFYACGTETTVDHVQVHMGSDDGIEPFGGGFNMSYIVLTGNQDDSLDCDQGFRGNIQYLFAQQDPAIGDNLLEWSNQGLEYASEPLTGPTLANATLVGSGSGGDKSKGATLKEGTQAYIHNTIFTNVTNEFIAFTQPETITQLENGGIVIENSLFQGSNAITFGEGIVWTQEEFETWLGDAGNLLDVDPELGSLTWTNPDPTPAAGSPVAGAGAAPGGSFFESADYIGAVEPGATNAWTKAPWINYSTNE